MIQLLFEICTKETKYYIIKQIIHNIKKENYHSIYTINIISLMIVI